VLYPALFEIQVRFPNRYFINKEAWSRLGNMACLNWKSDALATVVRPLPKGTGDPPKRHLRGNFFENPSRTFSIRVFHGRARTLIFRTRLQHEQEFDRITQPC